MEGLTVKCVLTVLLFSVCTEVVRGQTCNPTDGAALSYFNREFVYARNEFSTWQPGTDCCTWTGVSCDGSGNVIKLLIQNPLAVLPYPQGLFYLIGTGLLGLKNLISLTITNVAFNGGVPPSWGTGLSNIQQLELDGCNIVGPLPDTFCGWKSITNFSMSSNLMTGALPACMKTPYTTFPQLKYWNISGNNFS